MFKWKIVPISKYQLLDVREEDVLGGGHFRKCDTYRGGGGYDEFPVIFEKITGLEKPHHQFVAQVYGCNLDCEYCYVTRSGVWGKYVEYTSSELVSAFLVSGQQVFHLMGGAPALYLDHWPELLDELDTRLGFIPFHSDFLLSESVYSYEVLKAVARSNCLYAVSIKGTSRENYESNVRKPYEEDRMIDNLVRLYESEVNFYLTFTNPDKHLEDYKTMLQDKVGQGILENSFVIGLKEYKAVEFVDERPN